MADTPNEAGQMALPGVQTGGALAAPVGVAVEVGATDRTDFRAAASSNEESPKDQLNRLVTVDVDRAAQVLKKWMNEPERNAA